MGFSPICDTNFCTQGEDLNKSVCGKLGDGWHLPSMSEMDNLILSGATGWGGNNLSGIISNLPGKRSDNSGYYSQGTIGIWRTTREFSIPSVSDNKYLSTFVSTVNNASEYKERGYSVICIKN